MHKGYLKTAALLGALSVALGAFAAHKLKELVSEYALGIFETAVKYQFYHVFALLAAGILYAHGKKNMMKWAGIFFMVGMLFFCGSLYLLTWVKTAGISGMGWVGPITPLGGLFFILGWIWLFLGIGTRNGQVDAHRL